MPLITFIAIQSENQYPYLYLSYSKNHTVTHVFQNNGKLHGSRLSLKKVRPMMLPIIDLFLLLLLFVDYLNESFALTLDLHFPED